MKLKILLTLIILLLPAVTSLLQPGYFGASDDMHIGWLHQMHRAITSGKLPPRFVPDLSFGYGYPLFNFVYPLPFYLGEIFHQVFSLVDSTKLVFLVSLIGSGLAMYLLTRNVIASLIYVYTPYRSTDVYVRGAVGEAFAFVFLPLILYSLNHPTRRSLAIGGLSLAGLILSHNITALMFVPFVVLYVLITKINLKRSFLMLTFGLLVSLYFWLPALLDTGLLKYDTVFNFADHFPTLRQLITPYWGYGASVPGPYDGLSFYLGNANLLAILFSIPFFITSKNKKIFLWAYISLAICVFMMNYRSSFLWKNLPLIPYFQFPWRFLAITTFTTSVLAAQIKIFPKSLPLLALPILLLSPVIFKPHDHLLRTDSYYLNRYIPYPVASAEYRLTQEEYLRLPKTTQKRAQEVPTRLAFNSYMTDVTYPNAYDVAFLSSSPVDYIAIYNKYYFPGWIGKIDDQPISLAASSPFGQIGISIPAGDHRVSITYHETPRNTLLDLISLGAFLTCLGLIIYAKK